MRSNFKVIFFLLITLLGTTSFTSIYMNKFITLQTQNEFEFFYFNENKTIELEIYKISTSELIDYLSKGRLPSKLNPVIKLNLKLEGRKNGSKRISVENLDFGTYLVFLKNESKLQISILSKTRIWGKVVYLKRSAFIKFFDIITGEYLKDTELLSIDREGKIERIGTTNWKGEITIPKDENDGKLLLIKKKGVLIHSLLWPKYETKEYSLSFFTDRPIYKPGDIVHFGGFIKKRLKNGKIVSPKHETIEVEIKDRMGRKLYSKQFELDEFGAFNGDFETFEEMKRGNYSVYINIGDAFFYRLFRIEDYIKPNFKVKIEGKEKFLMDEIMKFSVDAKYYYGAPLSNIKFGYKILIDESGTERFYDSGTAKLDENGKTEISFKISNIEKPTRFILAVGISDESGAEVEEMKSFTVYPADLDLETEYNRWAVLGENFYMKFVSKNLAGEPIKKSFELKLTDPSSDTTSFLIKSDSEGKGIFRFHPDKEGEYKFRVLDMENGKIVFKGTFWVYESYYNRPLTELLEIDVPTDEVVLGKGLQINILSSFKELNGKLLVDLGDEIKMFDFLLKDGKCTLSLTLPKSLPTNNVDIWAFSAKAGRKLEAYRSLRVSDKTRKFDVSMDTDRDVYLPGSKVELKMKSDQAESRFFVAVVDKAVLDLFNGVDFWKMEMMNLYKYYYPHLIRDFNAYYWDLKEFFSLSSDEKTKRLLARVKSSGISLRSEFSDTAIWIPDVLPDKNGEAIISFKLPDNLTTWKILAIGINKSGMYGLAEKEIRTSKNVVLTPVIPNFFVSGDTIDLGALLSNNMDQGDRFHFDFETENLSFATEIFVQKSSRALIRKPYNVPENTEKGEIKLKMVARSFENPEKGDGIVLKRKLYPLEFKRNWAKSGIISKETKSLPIPSKDFSGNVSISTNVLELLMDSISALVGFPYGCVEQTMSKFLPTIIFKKLLDKSVGDEKKGFLKSMDQIVSESLKRLYAFQHDDGGWGWWKSDKTNSFMTAYVMHGFFIAKEAGYDINKDIIKNGIKALKSLLKNKDEYFYYVLYVLNLYEPNTLKITDLKKPKDKYEKLLYLITKLRNMKIESMDFNEIVKILKTGLFTNSHVELTKFPYFLSETQLNALLLSELSRFKDHSKEIGDICRDLTDYLLSKRLGNMWKSTKETAFCIMALSKMINDQKEGFYVKFAINGKERFSGILKGNLKIPLKITKENEVSLSASGVAFWSVDGETVTKFKDYSPISSRMSIEREIQRRIAVKFDNEDITLFIPIKNKLALDSIKTLNDPVPLKFSYILLDKDSSAFILSDGSLIFNNEYTGLKLFNGGLVTIKGNSLVVKGKLYRGDFQLSNNGLYELRFSNNEPLKIGDLVRSEIKIFGKGDFVVLEDPLPSTAIPIKEYREQILGKFVYESMFSIEKEVRFDRFVQFFRNVEDTEVYNYYRVMFPGKFEVLPAKIWEMYDSDNFASSEFDTLEVRF